MTVRRGAQTGIATALEASLWKPIRLRPERPATRRHRAMRYDLSRKGRRGEGGGRRAEGRGRRTEGRGRRAEGRGRRTEGGGRRTEGGGRRAEGGGRRTEGGGRRAGKPQLIVGSRLQTGASVVPKRVPLREGRPRRRRIRCSSRRWKSCGGTCLRRPTLSEGAWWRERRRPTTEQRPPPQLILSEHNRRTWRRSRQ